MIQIGTYDCDYIIDVFPVFDLIMSELKTFLEREDIVKYVFGCNNDALWLQRDFFIYLVSAVDLQDLFQMLLKDGHFDEVTTNIPFQSKKSWYKKYIGDRRNESLPANLRELEASAGSQPHSLEKVVELFYPNLIMDKDAQLADFRPRETKDPSYEKLLEYARNDVNLLLQLVVDLRNAVSAHHNL